MSDAPLFIDLTDPEADDESTDIAYLGPAHLWDQQLNESHKAYEAFLAYRDLGTKRSFKAVGQALNKSHQLMERWSSVWKWSERVSAWTQAERQRVEAERAARQKQMQDEELRDGEKMLARWDELWDAAKLHKTVMTLQLPGQTVVKTVALTATEQNALVKMRYEIGSFMRRALGMPSQVTQTQLTGSEGGPVDMTHMVKVSADMMADIRRQMDEYERQKRSVPQRTDPTKTM